MIKFLSSFTAFIALLAACTFAQAQVGICAPSNAPVAGGIGDGCSTPPALDVFPETGVFNSVFQKSCEWHDKCYTSVGTSYDGCNGNFLSDMKGACANNFPVWLSPSMYSSCIAMANVYHAAVVHYAQNHDPLPGFQRSALGRSRGMETDIRLNHCVPASIAATTLFDPNLITQVNAAWQATAHRLPTVYEFFAVVDNGPSIVDQRADWNTWLQQQAAVGLAFTPPVVNAPTRSASLTLTASPIISGDLYVWSMNGGLSAGTSANMPRHNPVYNTTYTASGFVSVVLPSYAPSGTATLPTPDQLLAIPPGARNAITFNTTYTESGSCGPSPKQYCL